MPKEIDDSKNCDPCLGYCENGDLCPVVEMARKIIASTQEGTADWTLDEINWALTITGDLKSH